MSCWHQFVSTFDQRASCKNLYIYLLMHCKLGWKKEGNNKTRRSRGCERQVWGGRLTAILPKYDVCFKLPLQEATSGGKQEREGLLPLQRSDIEAERRAPCCRGRTPHETRLRACVMAHFEHAGLGTLRFAPEVAQKGQVPSRGINNPYNDFLHELLPLPSQLGVPSLFFCKQQDSRQVFLCAIAALDAASNWHREPSGSDRLRRTASYVHDDHHLTRHVVFLVRVV